MPATTTDYDAIREAQARARRLQLEAAQLSSGATTFSDEVMERVRQARADRGISAIAQELGTTTGQLASEGASLRERTADVNPLDVDRMLAAQRGQTLGTLATLGQTVEERGQNLQEIIGAGTNRMVAQASLKQAEAQAAAQEARDIMDLLKLQYDTTTGGGGLSLTEALKLGEVTSEQSAAVTEAQNFVNDLDVALNLVRSGLNVAGPIAGRSLKLRALFNQDVADFLRTSQRLTAKRMFDIGGKVLPAQELERLTPFLPDASSLKGKTEAEVIKELEDLKRTFEGVRDAEFLRTSFLPYTQEFGGLDIQQFLGGAGGVPTQPETTESWSIVGTIK